RIWIIDMNFIYGVICHQLTHSLVFLVNELLKSPHSIILIHVDQKADLAPFHTQFGQHDQVYFLADRTDVRWGSYSQIEVMLKLLQEAQKYDYGYFFFLSGDDIPLCSNTVRELFLEKEYQKQTEFVGHDDLEDDLEQRVNVLYLPIMYQKAKSPLFQFLNRWALWYCRHFRKQDISHLPKLYKGSNWITFTDQAVTLILDYLEASIDYATIFKSSLCAYAIFFHTIIYNSHIQQHIYHAQQRIEDCETGLRYIAWDSGPDYPRTLDESDFDKMKQSDMLFARKMNTNITVNILEKHFS